MRMQARITKLTLEDPKAEWRLNFMRIHADGTFTAELEIRKHNKVGGWSERYLGKFRQGSGMQDGLLARLLQSAVCETLHTEGHVRTAMRIAERAWAEELHTAILLITGPADNEHTVDGSGSGLYMRVDGPEEFRNVDRHTALIAEGLDPAMHMHMYHFPTRGATENLKIYIRISRLRVAFIEGARV